MTGKKQIGFTTNLIFIKAFNESGITTQELYYRTGIGRNTIREWRGQVRQMKFNMLEEALAAMDLRIEVNTVPRNLKTCKLWKMRF